MNYFERAKQRILKADKYDGGFLEVKLHRKSLRRKSFFTYKGVVIPLTDTEKNDLINIYESKRDGVKLHCTLETLQEL